jgi:hypothetical protein
VKMHLHRKCAGCTPRNNFVPGMRNSCNLPLRIFKNILLYNPKRILYPDVGGSKSCRNIVKILPDVTASDPTGRTYLLMERRLSFKDLCFRSWILITAVP